MRYLFIFWMALLSCKAKQNTKTTTKDSAVKILSRNVCPDDTTKKIPSGFFLVKKSTNESQAIKLYNKEEYYLPDSTPVITMINIDTAYKEYNKYTKSFDLNIKFNGTGAQKWRWFTQDNINKQVGIIVCNNLLSVATIIAPIPDGTSSITGTYSSEELNQIIEMIYEGKRKEIEEYRKNYYQN